MLRYIDPCTESKASEAACSSQHPSHLFEKAPHRVGQPGLAVAQAAVHGSHQPFHDIEHDGIGARIKIDAGNIAQATATIALEEQKAAALAEAAKKQALRELLFLVLTSHIFLKSILI